MGRGPSTSLCENQGDLSSVMVAPIAGKEKKLYLTFHDNAIGIVLAQDDLNVKKKPIYYYASRILKEAEARYTKAERNCYIYAAKKLRHYMLAHKIKLVVGANPIRYLLSRPALSGRTARWLLQLPEFDIKCLNSKSEKGASFCIYTGPSKDPIELSIPGEIEQIATVEDGQWTLDESPRKKVV